MRWRIPWLTPPTSPVPAARIDLIDQVVGTSDRIMQDASELRRLVVELRAAVEVERSHQRAGQ